MISLVHIVKQKQTHGRERERERERVISWGTQLTQKFEIAKRKEPLSQKRLIRLLGRCSLLNILGTFFSEHVHGMTRPQWNTKELSIIELQILPGITGYYDSLNRGTIVAL